jgi:hypothetical protein
MYRGLVAFASLWLGFLRTPTQRPHHPPDVAGMVANAGKPFNDQGDAGQAPELGLQTVGARASEQSLLDPLPLLWGEPRLAASPTSGLERQLSASLPAVKPVLGCLARDAELTGDLGLGQAQGKEGGGFHAPLLHPGEVSPGAVTHRVLGFCGFHAQSISMEWQSVNLFYEIQ